MFYYDIKLNIYLLPLCFVCYNIIFSCNIQGQLRYKIIGDPPSPDYFRIHEQSGAIIIKKDLMKDYSPYYMVSLIWDSLIVELIISHLISMGQGQKIT